MNLRDAYPGVTRLVLPEAAEHIRICADKVDEMMRRKVPWHQREETWRPLADALKKEGLMR